jgi:hypothetical protein
MPIEDAQPNPFYWIVSSKTIPSSPCVRWNCDSPMTTNVKTEKQNENVRFVKSIENIKFDLSVLKKEGFRFHSAQSSQSFDEMDMGDLEQNSIVFSRHHKPSGIDLACQFECRESESQPQLLIHLPLTYPDGELAYECCRWDGWDCVGKDVEKIQKMEKDYQSYMSERMR